MYPKLYWDERGREFTISTPEEEQEAKDKGWDDIPNAAHQKALKKIQSAKEEKPHLPDAEKVRRAESADVAEKTSE